MKQGYCVDLEKETLANEDYRRVLFTTEKSQLVLMTLQAGEDIPLETHEEHDQFIRVESGEGRAEIGEDVFELGDGVAVVIPAGNAHHIVNTGLEPLKLYTLYTPPEHPEGTVHPTKKEADEYEEHHHG
jgi:mannose-6-phosphate isomerase-like protein (cupin superfamily)